uniref:ATP synthase F0 subunit 6 n=1 Tax=Corynosoma villosum TaxID=141829 RepID=UPI002E76E1CD|nr:ATP synthase F0 subunit 6 [Corynosoma villosum]WPN89819.1 ATP synthase F0 subunit 6 [Corynosoma villosum]
MMMYLVFGSLGVGVWAAVSGLGFKLPKDFSVNSLWVLLICGGVFSVWGIDNLIGMFRGLSFSMGYGFVMMVGLLVWLWGELPKPCFVGASEYLSHFSIVGVKGLLGMMLPFMETFSVLIRPLTLSVRLSTNITSGHVLLTMMSLLGSCGWLWGMGVLCVGWVLGLLEFFVCVLQAGIFSMLVVVYLD